MNVMLIARRLGERVRSFQGLELGTIEDFVVDEETAAVSFVVISQEEDGGPGERLLIVPWLALSRDRDVGGFHLGISKERLKRAPALERSELETLGQREVRAWVLSYYGFPSGRETPLEEPRTANPAAEAEILDGGDEDELAQVLQAEGDGFERGEEPLDPDLAFGEEPEEEDWSQAA